MIIIAALTRKGVIGKNNGLPWHIPEESAHFFRTTVGNTIISGRKTFESIGGGTPLPKRNNIVVSRSLTPRDGIDICRTFDDAVEKARSYEKEIYIGGGSEIYRLALPLANALYLSYIKKDYEGDVFFPKFDLTDWELTKEEDHAEYTFVIYTRLRPASA